MKTSGSWKPGRSGNPGGRAKNIERIVRDQFGDDIPKIILVLRDLALGITPDGYSDVKTSDRIRAGTEVLDRVIGRPKQAIEGDLSIGLSAGDSALLAALRLTPHERRQELAEANDDGEE